MKLPSIPVTSDVLTTPLFNKKINYSAYVCGQESILVQNADDKTSPEQRLNAIRQIITECTDLNENDVFNVPYAVIELLFCNIRRLSSGNKLKMKYRCANDVDGAECSEVFEVVIDLGDITINQPEGFNDTIIIHEDPVGGDIGVKMKLPTIQTYVDIGREASVNSVIAHCVEVIFHGDTVFTADNCENPEEWFAMVEDWWKTIVPINQMKVVDQFFRKIPHIYVTAAHTCGKCGKEHTFEYKSLRRLFG